MTQRTSWKRGNGGQVQHRVKYGIEAECTDTKSQKYLEFPIYIPCPSSRLKLAWDLVYRQVAK